MVMVRRMKISRGGQISVPAAVRKRWGTSTVTIEDEGERMVVRPAPDDPIEAVRGAFAGRPARMTTEEARHALREEEVKAEERRRGR